MPVRRIRTWEDMLMLGTSDLGLWMDADSKLRNTPHNLWPNPSMSVIAEDGHPESHSLDVDIAELVAYHYLLSRPGANNRLESMARQNSAPIPMHEGNMVHQGKHDATPEPGVKHEGAWHPGEQPEPTSNVIPPTPEIEKRPNDSRGFPAGRYGLAVGWSGPFGSAGLTGFVYFDLLDGEFPIIPRPDGIPTGASTFDIAMTRKDGNATTARFQRQIPIDRLTSDTIPIFGPWRNRGKPKAGNHSNVPKPSRPRRRDYGTMSSDYSTLAGWWTPAIQLWLPALPGSTQGEARTSVVGALGHPVRVKGDRFRVKVKGKRDGDGGSQRITTEDLLEDLGADFPDGWLSQNEIRNLTDDGEDSDRESVTQTNRSVQRTINRYDTSLGNFGGGKRDGQGSGGGGGDDGKAGPRDKKDGDGGGGGGGDGDGDGGKDFHYEWRNKGFKTKTALYFKLPKIVRTDKRERSHGLRATYWWRHESESGVITWYRAYDSRRGPQSYFDDSEAFDGRIECPGWVGDEGYRTGGKRNGQRGPRIRLIAEDPPLDPSTDTTQLEGPDPTSIPEEPFKGGMEVLPAGRYSAAVVGLLRGGGVTRRSRPALYYPPATGDPPVKPPPVPYIDIDTTQTIKVIPSMTVNLLRNAEGAQVNGRGEIEEWTLVKPAGGYLYNDENGVWRMGCTTAITAATFRADSALIPVRDDDIITFGADIGIDRWVTGNIRVLLKQYNEDRVEIANNLSLYDLQAAGEVSLSKSWDLANRDGKTKWVAVRMVVEPAVGFTQLNLEGYVKNLRVFNFDADIGKFDEGDEPGAVDFRPRPIRRARRDRSSRWDRHLYPRAGLRSPRRRSR